MSEPQKPVISPENQPTIVAALFVLTLLTLAFSLYNHRQIGDVAEFYGKLSVMSARKTADINDSVSRIADLEKRIATLEAQAKAATPAPEASAVPAAAPAAPEAPKKK